MKRPTMLLNRVLLNEALQVSIAVERDLEVIRDRFEDEGMSFLTLTLPSLDDALIQGLVKGRVTPQMFQGFKPLSRGGSLPALLQGFFTRVFDQDGSLNDQPCIASIRAIRQVTRLFKKVELPCSSARVSRAFERYVSNDNRVKCTSISYPALFRRVAGYLWSGLEEFSRELYCSPGIFGTGATAEKLKRNERHSLSEWPERGDYLFPLSYHGSHSEDDTHSFEGVRMLSDGDERPVRVVQVPKTLSAPRIISVEPSYMMLRQQSIAKVTMDYLEKGFFKYKSIHFTNQSVNRERARLGSLDGSIATIDLKDASDLVSLDLVQNIFQTCPSYLAYLEASRTRVAQMPDKSLVSLGKFASMGSAMCFPVEAMAFLTIVLYSLVRQSGRCLSVQHLRELSERVTVYGDDITVPSETAAGVMEDLEAFGLSVNHTKSFTTGFFRESCGGDFYKGVDVTPAYCRQWDFSGDSRDPRVVSALVSLSNQLYWKGLWNAAQYVRESVNSRFKGDLPRSTVPLGGLTFASVSFDTKLRWDRPRCGWRVKTPKIRVGYQDDPVLDLRAGMLVSFGAGYLSDWRRDKRPAMETKLSMADSSSVLPTSDDSLGLYERIWKGESLSMPPMRYENQNLDQTAGIPVVRPRGDLSKTVDSLSSNTKIGWADTSIGIRSW